MENHTTNNKPSDNKKNLPRYFVFNRQIAWLLIIATFMWGVFGYYKMPKRKDPEIPVKLAVAVTIWPGADAQKVEQLVTRKVEEKISQNSHVQRIESISRSGLSIVYVHLDEGLNDTSVVFDDIKMKLDAINDLPDGCLPIRFNKDFGDTAALMLTVASPKVSSLEISLRARSVQEAIIKARGENLSTASSGRAAIVTCLPQNIDPRVKQRVADLFSQYALQKKIASDIKVFQGAGFVGLDAQFNCNEEQLQNFVKDFIQYKLRSSEFPPDLWDAVVIHQPEETLTKLASVAGEKYTYRQLDDYTDLIRRAVQTVPLVSKAERTGILKEQIYLDYSQERLASYGIRPADLGKILAARNITTPGGNIEVDGKNLKIDPSGEFKAEQDIGNIMVTASTTGSPVYLRDLVDISRDYENPARFLNYYNYRDKEGHWERARAITLSIQMKAGKQIWDFSRDVDKTLAQVKDQLPEDLIIARTSDQPLQTRETIDLFMKSLYEAIFLVILVAFIGFWEWRSAVLMSFSIPLTLAMTFGLMMIFGIDLQFVSIGSMILALGLLVDVPVVSGDAIKRELEAGNPRNKASWVGPTKLSKAILFATITNIVAYLPFLMLSGDTGRFLKSLPIVLAFSLVASYIVAMTFIPALSYYLLRAPKKPSPPIEERRNKGFAGLYYKVGTYAIVHRWKVLLFSLIFLVGGFSLLGTLKPEFFPKDLSYLSYIDVWLPEDAPFSVTNQKTQQAEAIVRRVCEEYGKEHPGKDGKSREVLKSLTTFVGGGGPRFWFSVEPEIQQLNYAQMLMEVNDKHDTNKLVAPLQQALEAEIPGARVDVRLLETGKPVGIPVQVRISGEDADTLRKLADEMKDIFRQNPDARRIRDNWGSESFAVKLQVDPDRANLSGITNLDVAASSVAGMSGIPLTELREGDKQIPVVVRLRMNERAGLSDVNNLYVYSLVSPQKVPLREVSKVKTGMQTEKIFRRNQFRTITVGCFPAEGKLPSEILDKAMPQIKAFENKLPAGYKVEIGGEYEEQVKGFKELAVIMMISVLLIYMALVMQFKNLLKPLIVFAAIPYGMVGAFAGLSIMGATFGFMAFLGVASLIGVIVSHIIVLFDFIEERQEMGEPLREALLDAGIIRLRPVLITVGATVFGLIPLALHGGPLWEPLCYAQIGGLTLATFITLLLVPTFYAICVKDLKIIHWKGPVDEKLIPVDEDETPEPGKHEPGKNTPVVQKDKE